MGKHDDRVEKAITLFNEGYNCSQAVCAAFGDMYGFTTEQCFAMSMSFGGGIGRMRQTCGAACGMFIVAGIHVSSLSSDQSGNKPVNYNLVQELANKFSTVNGSLICAELLAMASKVKDDTGIPKKRSCVEMVRSAAQIWADYLDSRPFNNLR